MTNNQIQTKEKLDIEKELINMEEELKKKEDKFAQFQKEKEKLKNSIIRLKKAVDEINNSAGAYANAFPNLYKETIDIREFYRNQKTLFDADFTDSKKKDLNARLDKTEKRKDDYQDKKDKSEKAKEEVQKVIKIQEKKQKEFDSLKVLQKTIENKLKEIGDFKGSIEEEVKKGKKEHVHFLMEDKDGGLGILIEELDKLIEDSGIKGFSSGSPPAADLGKEEEEALKKNAREEFKHILMTKWNELNQAEEELRDKEEAEKKAAEEYRESQKAWEELQKDRKTKILEKYKDKEK